MRCGRYGWEFPKRKWIKGWNVGEPSYDGSFDFFEEWIERDVTDMVHRPACSSRQIIETYCSFRIWIPSGYDW